MHDTDSGGTIDSGPPRATSPIGPDGGRLEKLTATARRAMLFAILLYPIGLAFHLNLISPLRRTVAIDFVAFWSAARLAVQGAAISAFDYPTLQAGEFLLPFSPNAYFPWLYPPTFHILITPLGWFGFIPALTIFTAFTVGMYCLALRPWVRGDPIARNLAIAAPAVLTVVFTGNTSLLWAAAFLAAMHGLSLNRPAQAGLFIALLTLKPPLGILIPVALIAQRHWPAILWAIFFTLLFALLATAVHGLDYWVEFYRSMGVISARHAIDAEFSRTMITWFAFLRRLGFENDTANLFQIFPAIVALATVAFVWARRGIDADLKLAVLLLATLTATPYAFQYETMLILLAALFMLRAGIGETPAGRAWLATLWLMPAIGQLTPGLYIAQFAAPIISASLLACAVIALRRAPRAALAA
jgi:hypothetical protein